MTAAAEPDGARDDAGRVAGAKEIGLRTLLGVSNVSHGLPMRPLLNAAFVTAAAAHGLDAAIVNPNDLVVMEAMRTANADRATGEVPSTEQASARVGGRVRRRDGRGAGSGSGRRRSGRDRDRAEARAERLMAAVARGDADGAPALVDAVIASGMPATDVIPEVLTPAIQTPRRRVRTRRGVPAAADRLGGGDEGRGGAREDLPARVAGFEQGTGRLRDGAGGHPLDRQGHLRVAAGEPGVRGRPTSGSMSLPRRSSRSAGEADAVCLSALMTTTLRAMSETSTPCRGRGPRCRCSSAVRSSRGSGPRVVGAGYADDAPGCVGSVRAAIESRRRRRRGAWDRRATAVRRRRRASRCRRSRWSPRSKASCATHEIVSFQARLERWFVTRRRSRMPSAATSRRPKLRSSHRDVCGRLADLDGSRGLSGAGTRRRWSTAVPTHTPT